MGNFIRNNCIIIAPSALHEEIYLEREANPLIDFRLMTLEEVESYFNYISDDRLKTFLLKQGVSYSLMKELIKIIISKNLSTVKDKKYERYLMYQKEAINQKLLKEIDVPSFEFENKDIVVYGYQNKQYISELLNQFNPKSIDFVNERIERTHSIYSFLDIYEELHYVFNLVCKDIDQGTKPEDIHIVGLGSETYQIVKTFASFYNLGTNLVNDICLNELDCTKKFFELYKEKSLDEVRAEFSSSTDPNVDLIFKNAYLYNIYNNKDEHIKLLKEVFNDVKCSSKTFKNSIDITNNYVFDKDAHVYLCNFTIDAYPKTPASENKEFPDSLLKQLGRRVFEDEDYEYKEELNNLLNSNKVKFISFARNVLGRECVVSNLQKIQNYKVIEDAPMLEYEYSKARGMLLKTSLVDLKRKYLYIDNRLATFDKFVDNENRIYSYDNTVSPLAIFNKKSNLKLSASSLKLYYQCPFKYFIDHITNLGEFDPSFNAELGTMIHSILENHYKENESVVDWDKYINALKSKYQLSPIENLLLNRIKDEVENESKFIYEMDSIIPDCHIETEVKITRDVKNCENLQIDGRIDKAITFNYEGKDYIFLIDYKTGSETYDEDLLKYGLSLQLPLYSYLIEDTKYNDYKTAGLFISPLLASSTRHFNDKGESTWDSHNNNKLNGIFLDNVSIFRPFVGFINGLFINKDGYLFSKGTRKFKNSVELTDIKSLAETKLIEAAKSIRSNDFKIEPKISNGNKNDSCKYCQFMKICYRNKKQYFVMNDVEEGADNE